MNCFKTTALILFTFYTLFLNAQSKKDIRNNKISAITTITTNFENGKEISYKDCSTIFDKNGNIVEETEYFSNGTIKSKKKYKYNSDKNKIEEIEYDGKTKSTTKTIYSYNSEKNKISEVTFNENEVIIKKTIYIYDKNGLRIEKKTFDENNKLTSVKKYIYTKK